MSDTPRTDAKFANAPPADFGGMTEMAYFARQLERELNQWKQVADDLAAACVGYPTDSTTIGPALDAYNKLHDPP